MIVSNLPPHATCARQLRAHAPDGPTPAHGRPTGAMHAIMWQFGVVDRITALNVGEKALERRSAAR
jgi:hypothetical protein